MLGKRKHSLIYTLRIAVFFLFFYLAALPLQPAQAQQNTTSKQCPPEGSVRLQINLPMEGVGSCTVDAPTVKDGQIVPSGKKTIYYVENIQTYIRGIYKLFIGIVVLGAIIVIMFGGFQYIWAAGNQQRISSAKSMIGSALGGLVLALLSYTLLNTINPEIVSLRITKPQSVREIARTLYCLDVPESKEPPGCAPDSCTYLPFFAELPKNNTDPTTLNYNLTSQQTSCGGLFYVKGGAGNTCIGRACADENLECINGSCQEAIIYGSYTFDPGKYVDNDIDLWAICGNSGLIGGDYNLIEVLPTNLENYTTPGDYAVAGQISHIVQSQCNDPSKPPKFFLMVEVNDQGGTDDDWIVVPSDHQCDRPLVMCNINGVQTVAVGNVCEGGNLIATPALMDLDVLYNNTARPLWTQQQIDEGKYQCDLHITEQYFPEDLGLQTYNCPGGATGLTYNGINAGQQQDASTNLGTLLQALNVRVAANVNSISDDDLFTGNCQAWLNSPPETYGSDANCVHVKNSKHYGGTFGGSTRVQSAPAPRLHTTGFSCALDLGATNGNWSYPCLAAEVSKMKAENVAPISYWQCEKPGSYGSVPCDTPGVNHLHVEVSGCD